MTDYTEILSQTTWETSEDSWYKWELHLSVEPLFVEDVFDALYFTEKDDLYMRISVAGFGKVWVDFATASLVYNAKRLTASIVITTREEDE
jgi:hypothetical protein